MQAEIVPYRAIHGVARDLHAALVLYERAAHQGDLVAQYNLADMCLARYEFDKAHYWFLQAAKQGDADAQFNLAMIYERGLGAERAMRKRCFV